MIVGVILAGGKGSRMKNKQVNKTAISFMGKPMIMYGVESYKSVVEKTLVVVGHKYETVKEALKDEKVEYVFQKRRLGTGHALMKVVEHLQKANQEPELVIVGNGDNMLFHTEELVSDMVEFHREENAAVTLLSILPDDVSAFDNGRIVRTSDGYVKKIVERKEATEQELTLKELNTGFYCFDYAFVKATMNKLRRNEVTNEYHITDFARFANEIGRKVCAFQHDNPIVGKGINTITHLEQVTEQYKSLTVQV